MTKTTETAETFANEIIQCWTGQASVGVPMVVGDADEMGIWSDLKDHVPAKLRDAVTSLVAEGFRAFNESRSV